jgi:DNA replication protein DnaC
MQFIRQKQQVTVCPQCDNVVRIDADVCNICGKRLRPSNGKAQPASPPTPRIPPSSQTLPPPPPSLKEDEEEDEYEDEEEYEDEDSDSDQEQLISPAIPSTPAEILGLLQRLQDQSAQIERYFPADLPDKIQKLDAWRKQLQRARACAELLERPQLQQMEAQRLFKLRHHLAEAARALDFTREYSVKIIGHAGAGKSTLLAALIGRDIFPRLAGGAVTGVRTRIRLCHEQEPEELRVHFLTRAAFDAILKQTQQSIQQTTNARAREVLAAELSILLKASEAYAEQYLTNDPYVEVIARERWKDESSRYIEEPARDSSAPRLIRLVDYVEYTIRATPRSLLPPGSVLVDLPGGSAGQLRHDAILREELNEVDAVILAIGNNRFGDDDRTLRIFELVKRKIVQHRSPEVAASMVFLAVTHWDEINSTASLEKALGSLRPLLRDLPPNYSSYHHHGPNHDYFFYPLRGLDALLATLGVEKQKLDTDRLQEGRDYAGRVLSVYPELLQIDASLPATANAQDFHKVSVKQHEAMLRFSGLPELTRDLQRFLTNSRYEVQLRQAETQLAIALQHLEDMCWEHLNHYGVHSRDLQELLQEMELRKNKRGSTRFELLQKRTSAMHDAWADALRQFDMAIHGEHSPFHRALEMAHERAARRIKIRIMQGHFDHFIKVNSRIQQDSPAMEIGNRWVDIDGWNLIKALRFSFSAALERELNEPARTLAEAFLLPIAHKEEIDGSLDIGRIALGEFGGELDEIHKNYNKLKRSIREKARDICLYVSMSELLNEEKYAPTKDTPAVSALYRLVSDGGRPGEIVQQARQLMGPILDVICGNLAESTERRVAHLFRYELDKLETRQVYDSDRLDIHPTSVPGAFADLVNRLYSLLTERVLTSETLRQQLDSLQAEREADVDRWVELLGDTEGLRTTHRQN